MSVRRLATSNRVSVLVEAAPSRADAVRTLLAQREIQRMRAVSPGLFIARVPRGQLEALAAYAAVRFVEASRPAAVALRGRARAVRARRRRWETPRR